jgi:hypothetical protein
MTSAPTSWQAARAARRGGEEARDTVGWHWSLRLSWGFDVLVIEEET